MLANLEKVGICAGAHSSLPESLPLSDSGDNSSEDSAKPNRFYSFVFPLFSFRFRKDNIKKLIFFEFIFEFITFGLHFTLYPDAVG